MTEISNSRNPNAPPQIVEGPSGLAELINENVEAAKEYWNTYVPYANADLPWGVPTDNTLEQSRYDFKYRVFPSNLGEQSYNGHYMVININVQNGTRFDSVPSMVQDNNRRVNTFTKLGNELSKVDSLKFNIDKEWKDSLGNTLNVDSNLQMPRQTRRIVESIALYMPNTIVFDTNNDYEDIGLVDIGGKIVNGTSSIIDSLTRGGRGRMGAGSFLGKLGDLASGIGGVASDASRLLQRPINPRVEVLFRNTLQRTFQFDFLFAPSSIEESASMHQIIKTLRFHAAPEYQNGFGGFMYIPPSEFDITFFNRGHEDQSIPRISTCALTKLAVDFAPQGVYSTFSTGAPVSCRMNIEFRELEVITKLRVLQGF